MKTAYVYINYPNIVVLKDYLDVVKKALERCGYKCEFVKSLDAIDKKSLIVHPMGIDAIKYYLKGYKNFILWQQGATADESYMRNHSKLRYWMLNKIDTFAMKKARFILYVSDYMREHYEQLAGCSFKEKSYIMPCSNEVYDEAKKFFNDKVYKTTIARNIRLAEAPSFGLPIMLYDEKSNGADAYKRFAKEFLSKQ